MFIPVLVVGLLFTQTESEPREKLLQEREQRAEELLEEEAEQLQDGGVPETRSTPEWRKYITAWRRDVLAGYAPGYQFSDEAKQPLLGIRDPKAVPAIIALLKTERERRIQTAYMEALAKIGGKAALDTLVRLSLDDRYSYRRHAAQFIAQMPNRREAIPGYAKGLKGESTRDAALDALRISGLTEPVTANEILDPILTMSLIDALLVEQTWKVPIATYREWSKIRGMDRYRSFRTELIPVKGMVPNEQARTVLREYTGQDFGYDEDTWKRWYVSRNRGPMEE